MEVPPLTEEHVSLAESMISKGAVNWRCSGCRQPGHVLYTCPYLSRSVGTYFAFANYAYQQEPEQVMRRQQRQFDKFKKKQVPAKTVLQRQKPFPRMVAFAEDDNLVEQASPAPGLQRSIGPSLSVETAVDALASSDESSDTSSEN